MFNRNKPETVSANLARSVNGTSRTKPVTAAVVARTEAAVDHAPAQLARSIKAVNKRRS